MPGVITKITIIQHPILMFRLCGLRGILMVVTAKRGIPFLTILVKVGRI